MPRKRKGRPSWFRLQLTLKPFVDALDDADVGKGLKMALNYFATGEYPNDEDTSSTAAMVFCLLKGEADNSLAAYKQAIEDAKQE